MFGGDGLLFTDILKGVRNILGLTDKFSILLDINKSRNKVEMYEDHFLERLRLIEVKCLHQEIGFIFSTNSSTSMNLDCTDVI